MKESTRHARPLNSKGNGENVFMKDWYQFPAEPESGGNTYILLYSSSWLSAN